MRLLSAQAFTAIWDQQLSLFGQDWLSFCRLFELELFQTSFVFSDRELVPVCHYQVAFYHNPFRLMLPLLLSGLFQILLQQHSAVIVILYAFCQRQVRFSIVAPLSIYLSLLICQLFLTLRRVMLASLFLHLWSLLQSFYHHDWMATD